MMIIYVGRICVYIKSMKRENELFKLCCEDLVRRVLDEGGKLQKTQSFQTIRATGVSTSAKSSCGYQNARFHFFTIDKLY
jgi:hypothetical protein